MYRANIGTFAQIMKRNQMEDTKHIKISEYNYPLPDERIAKFPLAVRDQSKLLVYRHGEVSEDTFTALPEYLEQGELMIFNNTKVIQARLHFRKETGALIEVFCLEPIQPNDYVLSFQQTKKCSWLCMIGNLKKWKGSAPLVKECTAPDGTAITLTAELVEPLPGGEHRVNLSWTPAGVPFATVVEAAGYIPIPPYLNRESESTDATDYQTVYSCVEGSVAAPTAGLHFTLELLGRLEAKGIRRLPLTLHVGAGTFKPVKSELIGGHPMHTESFSVSRETLTALRDALAERRPIIAVGTTSVRTLESLSHLARLTDSRFLPQWDAYSDGSIDAVDALQKLIDYIDSRGETAFTASTAIMIAPGFPWSIVSGMVTNFHQPKSTLLLLVSAFVGDGWRRIYDYALGHGFRFLSYGDSSVLLRE